MRWNINIKINVNIEVRKWLGKHLSGVLFWIDMKDEIILKLWQNDNLEKG